MIRFIALELIRVVQAVRPAFGPSCCRFHPSCTEYAREAVETCGFFRVIPRVLGRLLRCHPLHPGGFDPVTPR